MNKSDFVAQLAQRTGLSQAKCGEIVNAIFDGNDGIIAQELSSGGKVSMTGFGSFSVRHLAARTGQNPKTGEPMEIEARNSPHFKAGSLLKGKVRG